MTNLSFWQKKMKENHQETTHNSVVSDVKVGCSVFLMAFQKTRSCSFVKKQEA